MNVTKLGQHLTSAFGIADIKAYLGLQRSDDLNPVSVGIWSTFAGCWPESLGLQTSQSLCMTSEAAIRCSSKMLGEDWKKKEKKKRNENA